MVGLAGMAHGGSRTGSRAEGRAALICVLEPSKNAWDQISEWGLAGMEVAGKGHGCSRTGCRAEGRTAARPHLERLGPDQQVGFGWVGLREGACCGQ